MTSLSLIGRSAAYHWRTNLAVVLGVAAAVSVLAGALVVGDSVRASLRELALGRLGRTDAVVSATGFFRDGLADDLRAVPGANDAAPLVVANGFVTHERSGRRTAGVLVYGVDERFWRFHGLRAALGVYASPALARELGAGEGDVLLTRLQRPSDVPFESLFGRKDDVARTVRLTLDGILLRERGGEFALQPQQAEVRALFVPLRRLQRDLGVADEVNTVLLAGAPDQSAFRSALHLDDLGVGVTPLDGGAALAVESTSGILNEAVENAARRAGEELHLRAIPVFTYLANTIRSGDRHIPYSLITATDLSQLPVPPRSASSTQVGASAEAAADAIVLNDWAARELDAKPGDRIDVDFYTWDPARGLETRSASFTLRRVVPISGLAADRRLAPDYPGITGSEDLGDWDPPFPIDLSRVRDVDERYWDEYRTTPKAFIDYTRGRELWRSRFGALTSIRFSGATEPPGRHADELRASLLRTLSPAAMGVSMYQARELALEAATGATDFGEYFTYFSFFIVISALMLTVLFFKLGIEQRLRQIGILRATGFTVAAVRRLLLAEAVALAAAGAILGSAGAIAYARVIVHGLRTWWVGAVGTTLLEVHVGFPALLAGAAGGIVAAAICIVVSLRSVGRLSPRSLINAQSLESGPADPRRSRWRRVAALGFLAIGLSLIVLGFARTAAQAGAFFGAGAALLVAFLLHLSGWLRARDARAITGGAWAIARLGFRGAAFRPGRSVLSAALIAAAAFIIVSVDAFRRGGGEFSTDRSSGTGGYVLIARAELPIVHEPNTQEGREALLLQAPELRNARFARFRVRPGQDASCLNLYRPTNPTIVAPDEAFVASGRFAFASSLAQSDAERANPWLLLNRRMDDGAVPAIADATSLQYVLHAAVGDSFTVDTGTGTPLVLRFVAALADSVLQGEIIIGESQFVRLFPAQQGFRLFLVEDDDVRSVEEARALATIVERELQPSGVDAVATSDRLAEFHRVENTYLSTFQALGGLGLLLGTIGLATVMFRNVLERRRELALLRAVGYDARSMSAMIFAEAAFLLGAGVVAGGFCAAVAIAPAWLGRGGTAPGPGLGVLLAAVVVAGLGSSLVAVRAALKGRMLEALRAE